MMSNISDAIYSEIASLSQQVPDRIKSLNSDAVALQDRIEILDNELNMKKDAIEQIIEELKLSLEELVQDSNNYQTAIISEFSELENQASALAGAIQSTNSVLTEDLELAQQRLLVFQDEINERNSDIDEVNQLNYQAWHSMIDNLSIQKTGLNSAQEVVHKDVDNLVTKISQTEATSIELVESLTTYLQEVEQVVSSKMQAISDECDQCVSKFQDQLEVLNQGTLQEAVSTLLEETESQIGSDLIDVVDASVTEVENAVSTLSSNTDSSRSAAEEEREILDMAFDALESILSPLQSVIDAFKSIASKFGFSIG